MSPNIRVVYDGQDRLGTIEQRGQEVIARNKRGQQLGTFESVHDAVGAISAAAAAEAAGS
jgi:hypothetical protein